jgi:hypothetical protein
MSAKQRNFWILLTLIAISMAGIRWLNEKQPSFVSSSSCHMTSPVPRIQVLPHINEVPSLDREPIAKNTNEVRRRVLYSYSCSMRRSGVEGTVVARVLVDAHGNYLRHRIISRTNYDLAHRSSRYLHHLEFIPAVRDHQTVAAWTDVELDFTH